MEKKQTKAPGQAWQNIWDSGDLSPLTLPTAEILSDKNARAFLVCGFLMKSFKKNILKYKKNRGSRLEITC